MRSRFAIVAAAVAVAMGTAGGVAGALSDDDTVTGPEADRAAEAALDATGGGTANAVERDDEDASTTWEVEVTKPNGATVDVTLDESYQVIAVESDSDERDDGTDDSGESDSDDDGREDDADETGQDDDAGEPGDNMSGPDADRAGKAALDAAGGGRVAEVDQDNEDGAKWEVAVVKPDGTTVDVRVDQDFKVLGVESDADSADEPGDD